MLALLILVLPVLSTGNKNEGVIFTNAPRVATRRLPKLDLGALRGGRRLSADWRDDVQMFALSDEWKETIIEKHNSLRAQVGKHAPCTASDMATLVWDDTLAAAAAAWAAQCTWAQDEQANAANSWGENLAFQWSSIKNVPTEELLTYFVQAWYNQTYDTEWFDDYVASKVYDDPQTQCRSYDAANDNCMIGAYTQLIWGASTQIGCAVSVCPQYSSCENPSQCTAEERSLLGNGGVYLVCKYSPPVNFVNGDGRTNMPYVQGQACAQCKNSCDESGYLCTAGTEITRCRDAIEDYAWFEVQGVQHTDCNSLIAGVENDLGLNWCTFGGAEPNVKICQLTCEICSLPAELGLDYCGLPPPMTTTRAPTTTGTTTTATTATTTFTTTISTVSTTTSSRAVYLHDWQIITSSQIITGSMTIEGLSYSTLTNQDGLEASVQEKLGASIAQEAGVGIGPGNVYVTTFPGSVAVQFTIGAPPSINAMDIVTTMRTSQSFSITIINNIESVSGIEAATNGELSVSGLQLQAPGEEPATDAPTAEPTAQPPQAPTAEPTAQPTQAPTAAPTAQPTQATPTPTVAPTEAPTTENPTEAPEPEADKNAQIEAYCTHHRCFRVASGTTRVAMPRIFTPMILVVFVRVLVM